MNRDTLYSMGVLDTKDGATITFPTPDIDSRYVSLFIIDNDHYGPFVIHEPGQHTFTWDPDRASEQDPSQHFTYTQFVGIAIRIQVLDPNDPLEIEQLHELQEGFIIKASSDAMPNQQEGWTDEEIQILTTQYEAESKDNISNWIGMMGSRPVRYEDRRHWAAAAVWGLLPETEAVYLNQGNKDKDGNYEYSHDEIYTATFEVPYCHGFWSITVYNGDGFMENENCIIRSVAAKLNPDDTTFTVYFLPSGTCVTEYEDKNWVYTCKGWNYTMRLYQLDESKFVKDESGITGINYELPELYSARE